MEVVERFTTGLLGADIPDPLSEMTCGLSAALSVMVVVAVNVVTLVGVKVTEMLQDAPAARLPPHVVVSANAPVVTMLVMVSDALPVFVIVTVCGTLVVFCCCPANVRLVADSWTMGADAAPPNPESEITCGLPEALSVIVVVPVEATALDGLNVTEIVQFAPAASEDVQVVVLAKGKVVTILVMESASVPVLVIVTI